MDYIEILTLYDMVQKYHMEEEVAKELGIKKSSLRRQMNRIKAFHEGRDVQKRSGKRIAQKYAETMRKVLEPTIRQPVITKHIDTPRRLQFNNLEDLIRYRQPIAHISSIRKEVGLWELQIAISSSL